MKSLQLLALVGAVLLLAAGCADGDPAAEAGGGAGSPGGGAGGGGGGAGGSAGAGGSGGAGGQAGGGGSGGAGGSAGAGGSGGAGGSAGAGGSGGTGGAAGAPGQQLLWGITIDDPWSDRPAIVDSLRTLRQPTTTRIVFDEGMAALDYDTPVREIAAATRVQGLILDSFYVSNYTVAGYLDRTEEYLDQLGDVVDVWEIGNEVNGEWLGSSPEVSAKIYGAWLAARARGKPTALTLYYNGSYDGGVPSANNCWEDPSHQMFVWAGANVPQDMRDGLDRVLVSYYEDDCPGIQPDWQAVFEELAGLFPNAQLGIGECGTLQAGQKEQYIQRYYRDLVVTHPRYAGGYFWWYGKQDFVPRTNPLWQVLQDAMDARERSAGP